MRKTLGLEVSPTLLARADVPTSAFAHETAVLCVPTNVCSWWKSGRASDIIAMTAFDRCGPHAAKLGTGCRRYEPVIEENTMPFVRIDLMRGKPAEYRKALGEIVYQAMIDVINVPKDDKFQVITEHAPEELNFPASYLGNHYSQDVVFIQITLNAGRSIELKKAFYKRIVDDIVVQLKTRPDDVVINLVEVPKENWSYGFGIAQYVA
jgi:phenylpyruvate tautomerase PptA (4-oxalocrotonate tautomerase family)